MQPYRTYNKIQDRIKIKGILTIKELGLLLIFLAIMVTLGAIIGSFMEIPKSFYLVAFGVDILWFTLLKLSDRQGHPTFLFSYISFKFMQPKKLAIKEPFNFKMKKCLVKKK